MYVENRYTFWYVQYNIQTITRIYALCLYQIEVTLHQWTLANAVMVRNNWENIIYMMAHCFRTWHNDGILLMQWYILILYLHWTYIPYKKISSHMCCWVHVNVLFFTEAAAEYRCDHLALSWLWPQHPTQLLYSVLILAWDSSNETGLPFMNCWGVDHVSSFLWSWQFTLKFLG